MRLFLTRKLIEVFAVEALLSEQEIIILRSIAKGLSREQMSDFLHISVPMIDKKISTLKQKYDFCASYMTELPDRADLAQFNTEQKPKKAKGG